jgi:hypothetical protein
VGKGRFSKNKGLAVDAAHHLRKFSDLTVIFIPVLALEILRQFPQFLGQAGRNSWVKPAATAVREPELRKLSPDFRPA